MLIQYVDCIICNEIRQIDIDDVIRANADRVRCGFCTSILIDKEEIDDIIFSDRMWDCIE